MLRIGKMTDYGIVILAELAQKPAELYFNAKDLSQMTRVPLPTVSKILKILARGEILDSQRGLNGGYRLARPAHAISVADIIQQFEGPMRITECSHPQRMAALCGLERVCSVRNHWQKINDTALGALKSLTLFDMAQPFTPNFPREVEERA